MVRTQEQKSSTTDYADAQDKNVKITYPLPAPAAKPGAVDVFPRAAVKSCTSRAVYVPQCAVLYSSLLHSTLLYSTLLYSTLLYCAVA